MMQMLVHKMLFQLQLVDSDTITLGRHDLAGLVGCGIKLSTITTRFEYFAILKLNTILKG